jgi:hypothetical protein
MGPKRTEKKRKETNTGLDLRMSKERHHFEERGVDGSMILKWIVKQIGWEHVHRINPAYEWNLRRAVVITAMNFWVS